MSEQLSPSRLPPHPQLPPRNLCLFFDGTGTAAFFDRVTNVATLFSLASHCDETQLVYYQAGIGTPIAHSGGWQNWLHQALSWISSEFDQAIAFSLSAHIQRGYAFLMNNWHPGDRIFLFGFSRGAYTARALAGMLYKVGLLPKGNEETIQLAYSLYKRKSMAVPSGLAPEPAALAFKRKFCREVDVHFLGMGDTVRSVGGLIPRTLPFAGGAAVIHHFRQALALDERRAFYKHQPWLGREADACNLGYSVKEVWFAGSHGDVGGNVFPYDGDQHATLGHLSLQWMAREAVEQGLVLNPGRVKDSPLFRPSKRLRYHQPTEHLRYDRLAPAIPPSVGPVSATPAAAFPRSDPQTTHRVSETADQLLWTHYSAFAPRTDCLSFRLAKPDCEESTPGPNRFRRVKAFSSRLCRRIGTAGWWSPEFIPHLKLVEERDKKDYLKLRLNLGRGRKVTRDATIHRSVLDRMDAFPSAPGTAIDRSDRREGAWRHLPSSGALPPVAASERRGVKAMGAGARCAPCRCS